MRRGCRKQLAGYLDVFGVVVDDDRGLEDSLSQVALVLTGQVDAPLHLHHTHGSHQTSLEEPTQQLWGKCQPSDGYQMMTGTKQGVCRKLWQTCTSKSSTAAGHHVHAVAPRTVRVSKTEHCMVGESICHNDKTC